MSKLLDVVMSNLNPIILVFSGKRKTGKDYIVCEIVKRLSVERCAIMKLANPIKSHFAKEHHLDYEKLLDSSCYKEHYRAEMVKWGEDIREKDPHFFIRLITKGAGSEKEIWIISDGRRRGDIGYLKREYGGRVVAVRVEASEMVRKERGWLFTPGIDDAETECALDAYEHFDLTIHNDAEDVSTAVNAIIQAVNMIRNMI